MMWFSILFRVLCIFSSVYALNTPDLRSAVLQLLSHVSFNSPVSSTFSDYLKYDYLNYVGLSSACSYVDNFPDAVNRVLRSNVVAQDEAISAIVKSLYFLKGQREGGKLSPLVMAITGSTGVGKSETAKLIAQGLFRTSSGEEDPCGLLMLSGKDYSFDHGMSRLQAQRTLKNEIIDHLQITDGNALIVIDEIQSMIPGVLEVISSGLDEAFPHLSRQELEISTPGTFYPTVTYRPLYTGTEEEVCSADGICHSRDKNSPGGSDTAKPGSTSREVTRKYTTARAIFIFISDIGSEAMKKLLFEAGERHHLSTYELRREIKQTLDQQWERLEMFTKSVNEVIPYLPLEPIHIEQIFAAKFEKFVKQFQLKKWLTVVLEEEVIMELTSAKYISYSITGAELFDELTNQSKKITKRFAKQGARNLEKGGPLQDLKSLLYTFNSPDHILHIGMITPEILPLAKQHWQIYQGDQIYYQWCHPQPSMLAQCSGLYCEEIIFNSDRYRNSHGDLSLYFWHKLVAEGKGYQFQITTDHTFNLTVCQPGQLWQLR